MDRTSLQPYSPTILRIVLGLLFLIPGIGKLTGIAGVAGFFGSLGIPAATAAAWIVGIIEVLGGLLLLLGWKTEWVVWPLFAVLLVATVLVALPSFATNPSGAIFHVLGLAVLVSLYATGPGKWAVSS